jgi:hypothetical protein
MEEVNLSDVMATIVSEEVSSLYSEIVEICDDKDARCVRDALWFILLDVFMQIEECSLQQALKHVRTLTKITAREEAKTRVEAIA